MAYSEDSDDDADDDGANGAVDDDGDDVGYLDDENFVYVVDRAKDIIIRGGTIRSSSIALAKQMKPNAIPGEIIRETISPKTGISPNKNIAVQ